MAVQITVMDLVVSIVIVHMRMTMIWDLTGTVTTTETMSPRAIITPDRAVVQSIFLVLASRTVHPNLIQTKKAAIP